jgi:two-component system response regulator NreC
MLTAARDRRIRVFLADGHDVARTAVSGVLRSLSGVVLVGEAATRSEIARGLGSTSPDVLVIDDDLVGRDGWGLVDAGLAVVVMGLDGDPAYARRAHDLGAAAWVPKEHADDLLPDVLARAGGASPRPALRIVAPESESQEGE